MFALLGMLIVVVSVVSGYLASHGNLLALWQPFEMLIILGAAFGSFLIATDKSTQLRCIRLIPQVIFGSKFNHTFHTQLLCLVYSVFQRSRSEGFLAVEADIEHPHESPLFNQFPDVVRQTRLVDFFADNYRVFTITGLPAHELDAMMDEEIEQIADELKRPSVAVHRVAEALPGFGIVAAVLGIVITMGAIGGPMEEIGAHVAAALVGTFLGVFFAYGFVGPMSAHFEGLAEQEIKAYLCVKACLSAVACGHPPPIAVEAGRKLLQTELRPTFIELSEMVKQYR